MKHKREHDRKFDESRPSASKRGYDANWQRVRRMFLREHPLCEDPFGYHGDTVTIATEVHHKVALRSLPGNAGGTNHPENLQALCKGCHSRITGEGLHDHH